LIVLISNREVRLAAACNVADLSILAADFAQPQRLFLAVECVDATLIAHSLHTRQTMAQYMTGHTNHYWMHAVILNPSKLQHNSTLSKSRSKSSEPQKYL